MLLTRVLSALVLAPIVIALILIGEWVFAVALAIALGVAAWEFTRMMQRSGFQPAWIISLALIAALVLDAQWPDRRLAPAAISLTLIASLTWHLAHRTPSVTADWALAFAGGLYIGWAGRSAVLIRSLERGGLWLLLVLVGVWLADSGAYLIGSRIGRHKMTPTLSPKKSWEGLLGGMAFGVIGNGLFAAALGLPSIHGAALGLLGGTIGTLGDLSISMMKRQAGVKDSGNLIPGHGGVLDRIDSLLLGVIAGYLYVTWFAGLG
jgi:phosphatidate cytidylyltransferase